MTARDEFQRPSVDHSLLSPSGRMSRIARDAALAREAAKLFPPGYWDAVRSTDETLLQLAERLRWQAQEFRDLADRGMRPRKYRKLAQQAEEEAERLTAQGS